MHYYRFLSLSPYIYIHIFKYVYRQVSIDRKYFKAKGNVTVASSSDFEKTHHQTAWFVFFRFSSQDFREGACHLERRPFPVLFNISVEERLLWCLLTNSFVPSRPVSLRSLTPFTFNKAGEIGNDLLSHSNNPAIAGIYSGRFHLRREWMPLGQSLFVWALSAYYSRGRDRSGAEAFEVWIFTSAKVGFGSVGCSARFFVG